MTEWQLDEKIKVEPRTENTRKKFLEVIKIHTQQIVKIEDR